MMKLKFSVHLSNMLNVHDIKAITLYLEKQPKMGIHILDRYFAIRKSKGLVSFSRIDIYLERVNLQTIQNNKHGACIIFARLTMREDLSLKEGISSLLQFLYRGTLIVTVQGFTTSHE